MSEIPDNFLKHLIGGVKDYAIFALDTGGNIISWNAGAERIKGYSAQEIIGKHFSTFYTQESKDRFHPEFELREAIEKGSYEEEGWRLRKNGQQFWANVVITPLYDDDGKHIGFAKVTRDLTERRMAQEENLRSAEALTAMEQTFNMMIAAVKDYAIFMLSPEGIIKTWNSGAEKIKGYKAEEAIGRHFSIFYTDEAKQINYPAFELQEALKNGSFEEEGWRVKKNGSLMWASVTITPIRLANNSVAGYIKVTRDLSERRRNQELLEQARDEALIANQLKSKFVANVTHEIRTPLSGIVGLSELIAGESGVKPAIQDSASRIFDASKQLLQLVNDLLDFSKLEAGKMEIEHTSYAPAKVLDVVIGLNKLAAKTKSIDLIQSIEPDVPSSVIGDPGKIRQVLLNLVSNAIKFTEKGGVSVAVELDGEDVVYTVTDTGMGISKLVQDKLFKPFVQASESTSRLFGGTGLGLAIAQQLVELMSGRIGIVSEPNQGTTVWFRLPLVKEKKGKSSERQK